MKLWARVFLGYFLIVGLAGWLLLRVFVSEVKPGVRDAVEDVMVDTAQLLAELARDDLLAGKLTTGRFAQSVDSYRLRPIKAAIWGLEKQTLDFQVYVTDAAGIVRFDSERKAQGADYSNWRDVARTLRGEYGSRSTRVDPYDQATSVMHVAAAVRDGDRIVGVVTVAKPSNTLAPIIARGENAVLRQGFWLLGATLLIGGAFTAWLTLSMRRLVRYAQLLASGQAAQPPSRGRNEIGELSRALAKLRNEVDGRAYVEHYVQNLTHEMKSPLAALRGAAELLSEPDLPPLEHARFIGHVRSQSERLALLIDKLLRLAQLEQQRELEAPVLVNLPDLMAELEQAMAAQAVSRGLTWRCEIESAQPLRGEPFLLSLALVNLVQNALDFSPPGGFVSCKVMCDADWATFVVQDQGPGLAEFAGDRIFERFYSLPRPDGRPKSTGLGLALVRQIAVLHGGTIQLENVEGGGARASLKIALRLPGKREDARKSASKLGFRPI